MANRPCLLQRHRTVVPNDSTTVQGSLRQTGVHVPDTKNMKSVTVLIDLVRQVTVEFSISGIQLTMIKWLKCF